MKITFTAWLLIIILFLVKIEMAKEQECNMKSNKCIVLQNFRGGEGAEWENRVSHIMVNVHN